MRFGCPRCRAVYDVPEALLHRNKNMFRCQKCGLTFQVEIIKEEKPPEGGETPILHQIPSHLQEDFQRAVEEGHAPSMMKICRELISREQYDLIPEIFKRTGDRFYSHSSILVYLGDAYLALGELDKAVGVYQRVLSASPQNLRALRGLGLSLYRLGKAEEARPYLERTLAESGADAEVKEALNSITSAEEETAEVQPGEEIPPSEEEQVDDYVSFGDLSSEEEAGVTEEPSREVSESGESLEEEAESVDVEEEEVVESMGDFLAGEAEAELPDELFKDTQDLSETVDTSMREETEEESEAIDFGSIPLDSEAPREEGIEETFPTAEEEFSITREEADQLPEEDEVDFGTLGDEMEKAEEKEEDVTFQSEGVDKTTTTDVFPMEEKPEVEEESWREEISDEVGEEENVDFGDVM